MDISNVQKVKVFEPVVNEHRKNTYTVKLSSYEGKTDTGEAKYSSWRAYFVGEAFHKAENLKNGQDIILTRAKVENSYNKEKQQLYVNVTVFDFTFADEEA